jgi:hypothetical protein
MICTTGFGYLTKDGKITDKYELPLGEHPLKEGYDFVEVEDQAALDAVEIYVEPVSEEVHAAQETEILIQKKTRDLSIQALKSEGSLDEGGMITTSGLATSATIKQGVKNAIPS